MRTRSRVQRRPAVARRVTSTTVRIVDATLGGAPALLEAHGCPDELWVRDVDLKGFVLKLRPTGRHVFGVHFARGRFLNLGGVDRLTAGGARKAARDALAQTALTGAPTRAAAKASSTLGAFLDVHYEPWAAATLKSGPETVARIRVQFASLLRTPLAEVTPFAVEKLRLARLKAETKRATVNRDVGALRAALNKAVTWGLLKGSPLASVKPYRVDSKAIVRYLSADEEINLRAALAGRDEERRRERDSANAWRRARGYDELPTFGTYTDHLTPIVLLAINTGLRRGELFRLNWRDVSLDRALLTVRGEGAKSGQTRHVPLNSEAIEVLRTWAASRATTALRITTGRAVLVYPAADGDDVALEDIKKGWARLLRAAKIEAFRFHDLRHHFASRLVQAGVDLNTVRELLGHADIKMVLRYAHLAPETKAAAVAKLVR
jgi:integrase